MEGVAVTEVLQVLKQYFLPDASDHVYQDVWKFLHHKRTDQTMERFLLEFDLLRSKAERKFRRDFDFRIHLFRCFAWGMRVLRRTKKPW